MTTSFYDQDPQLIELFDLVKVAMIQSHTTLDAVGDLEALSKRIVDVIERSEVSNELAEAVGPFYDTAGLVSWLGYTKQALDKRRKSHKLLGCRTQDGKWVYPIWQFQENGDPIPGLSEVTRALAAGTDDAWTWALWFTGEAPERLEGMSARDWLTRHRDPERVLQIARIDAAAWAA